MTGKQLKNSILQLAIQGKLVPQDPHDEPASVLLQQIRREKELLVKEGKLKKKDLVSAPITDEEKAFEIPESWEWCRLGDIGITNTGTTPSKANTEYFGSFIPFLGPGDIQNGEINYLNNGLSEKGKEIARPVCKDTILQVCIGGSIGKCAFVDREVTFNQQINSISAIQFYFKYLYHCMSSDFFVKEMIANSTGTATPIINRGSWERLPIPLPPLAEQHRIVAKIEELMPLVEEYDKAQTQLDKLNAALPDALKKSILQEAIQGKLVPQDPNDEPASVLLEKIRKEKEQLVKEGKLKKKDLVSAPITDEEKAFEIPESWEWCRLIQIVSPDCSLSYGIVQPMDDVVGGVPVVRPVDMNIDTVKLCGLKRVAPAISNSYQRTILKGGEILFCVRGTVGKISFASSELRGANVTRGISPIRFNWECLSKYAFHFFNSNYAKNIIKDYAKGAALQQINIEDLKKITIPLPPLAEQHRIVAKLEELLPKLDNFRQVLEKSKS